RREVGSRERDYGFLPPPLSFPAPALSELPWTSALFPLPFPLPPALDAVPFAWPGGTLSWFACALPLPFPLPPAFETFPLARPGGTLLVLSLAGSANSTFGLAGGDGSTAAGMTTFGASSLGFGTFTPSVRSTSDATVCAPFGSAPAAA